jgi:hypothetical protein
MKGRASMPLFTEFERDPNAETGVMWETFITAIGVFVYTNEDKRPGPTVADAALAFNTTPDLVREAVGEHPWLFAEWADDEKDPNKQFIMSDGE